MIVDEQEKYERWWLGKRCRLYLSQRPFKKVIKVELVGPPSFVYGSVWLHYEDGTNENVYCGNAFKPRKKDVEVSKEG